MNFCGAKYAWEVPTISQNIVILKLNDSGSQKHSVWNRGWNGEILSGPGDPPYPNFS